MFSQSYKEIISFKIANIIRATIIQMKSNNKQIIANEDSINKQYIR